MQNGRICIHFKYVGLRLCMSDISSAIVKCHSIDGLMQWISKRRVEKNNGKNGAQHCITTSNNIYGKREKSFHQ